MKILLLDADPSTVRTLDPLIAGGELLVVHGQAEGLRQARSGNWDLVLLDVEFSGAGLEILGRLAGDGGPPIALVAERPSIEMTLRAVEAGAHEVMAKPLSAERIRELAGSLTQSRKVRPLRECAGDGETVIGSGARMIAAFKTIARVARSDATVLVLGESGTGKEMVARVLHARSARARGPFVAINCAAIPENLLESELFGHEKGAFTGAIGRRTGRFERANGGTLFLDEIGDMSMALQSKILRALQEREVERVGGGAAIPFDARIVAATNRDLSEAVSQGRFREDLFYRLAVISLHLPPLRERGSDLDLLVEHYAALYARQHGRRIRGIAEDTLRILREHPWPGNVRQLRNAMERAVVMSEGEVLLPEHLPADLLRHPAQAARGASTGDLPLCTLADMERRLIRRALDETGGNATLAAEILGIHRNTLRRKIIEYGLEGA